MQRILLGLAFAIALSALSACDDGEEPTSVPRTAEIGGASAITAAVLTLADLGGSWESVEPDSDAARPLPAFNSEDESCKLLGNQDWSADSGLSSWSGEFYNGQESVVSWSFSFENVSSAEDYLSDVTEHWNRCRRGYVAAATTSLAADPNSEGIDVQFVVERAQRLESGNGVTLRQLGDVEDGVYQEFVDITVVQLGRVVSIMRFWGVFPADRERDRIVAILNERADKADAAIRD